MSDQSQGSNWNLPNALTTLRIVMVPFFGYALLHDGGDSITWRCIAFALFVAAMITDKIDGTSPAPATWSPTSARSPTRSPTRR